MAEKHGTGRISGWMRREGGVGAGLQSPLPSVCH